jgi:hypothetical protein
VSIPITPPCVICDPPAFAPGRDQPAKESRDLTGLYLLDDVVFDQHSLRVRDLSRSSARDSSRRGEGSNTGLKPEVNYAMNRAL